MLLDTTHDVATPEGVELRLPLAGLASRSLAWLVDALIKTVALSLLSVVTMVFGNLGTGLGMIGAFLLMWFYNVLFEVLNHGSTPGKHALGLRVVYTNGTPVGWTGSILRNLIRFVDMLPGCYAFGCVSVLLSRRFQRLGDMAAGTVVVYRPEKHVATVSADTIATPLNVPLSLDEQQAIVTFGERAAQINEDRAEELASILEPVLGPLDASKLRGYAKWMIRGDRAA